MLTVMFWQLSMLSLNGKWYGTGAVGMKNFKQLHFRSSCLDQAHEIICTGKLCIHWSERSTKIITWGKKKPVLNKHEWQATGLSQKPVRSVSSFVLTVCNYYKQNLRE
jgi:hypothetical protein